MSAKQILALNTGSKVSYPGVGTLIVIDWVCHHEPIFALDGTRIDAEPVFRFPDGLKHTVHSRYWEELKPIKA